MIYFLASIGGLTTIVFLGYFLFLIGAKVICAIEELRYNEIRKVFIGQLHTIDRWCSHEFPEVGLVMQELLEDWNRGVRIDPDRLREKLRNLKEVKGE